MVQSHCKIKGSLSLPPIGGFITNIALSRKVRARKPAPPPGAPSSPCSGLAGLQFLQYREGVRTLVRSRLFGRLGLPFGRHLGIGDWELQLELNKRAFALEFVQRARFLAAYPTSMTADQFVTKLEQNVGGALSASEKAALIALLGSTPADSEKRAQVVRTVADDADLRQAEFNRAFVLTQYYGYLRRNPDDPPDTNFGGWKFWLDKLNQFNGNFIQAEMVKAFISSIEYRERFGP